MLKLYHIFFYFPNDYNNFLVLKVAIARYLFVNLTFLLYSYYMIRRINIKDDHPPVDIAVSRALNEIECSAPQKEPFLKIIHGYGSGGTGGEIKKQLHLY